MKDSSTKECNFPTLYEKLLKKLELKSEKYKNYETKGARFEIFS